MSERITIIYDGQCPFCASYVSLLRLREVTGSVELVDARSDDPRVEAALSDGRDLDEGMLVIWDGKEFFGRDAVHLLASLSDTSGGFSGLQRWLFSSPRRAALIYPTLARGRRLFLRLARRETIARQRKIRDARE